MTIKSFAKKMLPKTVWNFLRHGRGIARDLWENKGSRVCRTRYCGFDVCYGPGDLLIKKTRDGKIFEEKMCRLIVEDLGKAADPVFLDIGANIGLISLYVASKLPTARIFAFEPGPKQSGFFARTIALNGLAERVTLAADAVGEKEEKKTFMTHFSQDASGDGFIDTGRAGEPTSIDVTVRTLDAWWVEAGRPKVNVVKIDTEGSELLVLRGATTFLASVRPVVYLEIEPKNLKVYPYKRDDILKWFQAHDYRLSTLDGELCTPENFTGFIGRYDTYIAR